MTDKSAQARIAELEGVLKSIGDDRNWFHTSDESGGPYTAWRGEGEPDEIARAALTSSGGE